MHFTLNRIFYKNHVFALELLKFYLFSFSDAIMDISDRWLNIVWYHIHLIVINIDFGVIY